jgi:hypothetical protein
VVTLKVFTCPVARVIQFVGARAAEHVHWSHTHKPCQALRTDRGRERWGQDAEGITFLARQKVTLNVIFVAD